MVVRDAPPTSTDIGYHGLEALLDLGTVTTYDRGEVIFHQRSNGRDWYIVLDGLVQIAIDPGEHGDAEVGLRTVMLLGPGKGFGEMAFVDGSPRSAHAIAARPGTRLLVITPESFERAIRSRPAHAAAILHMMVRDLSAKLRHLNGLFAQQLVLTHHIRALREELEARCSHADPLTPLETTVTIRDRAAFVLAEHIDAPAAQKECITVLVFAEPRELHALLTSPEPGGESVLHALFALVRSGELPERGAEPYFQHEFIAGRGRRAGRLCVLRAGAPVPRCIEWELKGVEARADETHATLSISVLADPASQPRALADDLIASTPMPILRTIARRLGRGAPGAGYRILVVHHRTHEVARTLQELQQLGYQIDALVGIPYGEASWPVCAMLDRASGRRYLCLRPIPHPQHATRYTFDFVRSSALSAEMERRISQIFADPANTAGYMPAMSALVGYVLEQAIRTCRERGERLLIYEDGAYVTPIVYAAFHDPSHPLHEPVREAVESGVLVGSVEVTTSGERRQAALIAQHGGRGLLPVLSVARNELKLIYEAVGVAEAVLHAAATALGNLGLPTFGARRIAVAGGNGAIGTRIVEQLARAHNGTGSLFVVDPSPEPFAAAPSSPTTALGERLSYQPIPRHTVTDRCLPVILACLDGAPSARAVAETVHRFLADDAGYDELAVAGGFPLPARELAALWREVAERSGYRHTTSVPLGGHGALHTVERAGVCRRIALLRPGAVFVFTRLERLLRAGIDTVIGMSGVASAGDAELRAFLERPAGIDATDDLILISGSSKDHEFQPLIARLNQLVADPAAAADWIGAPCGCAGADGQQHTGFAIRKTIHPDVGSVYHIRWRGMRKRVVLVADGLVVNFFARYEKGVKTEYMDPIMTLQLLGLARLSGGERPVAPGLHGVQEQVQPEHIRAIWRALDERYRPPLIG